MAIEARGGKTAYVYFLQACKATRRIGNVNVAIGNRLAFDVADSEDEAYGRAMKMAHLVFPESNSWTHHTALTREVSGIDWISRHDFSKIQPEV